MPGLFGFLRNGRASAEDNRALFKEMSDRLFFEHNEIVELYSDDRFYLGASILKTVPNIMQFSDDRQLLLCHGDIYKTKVSGETGEGTFRRIVDFYYEHGDGVADALDGDFNFVIYDKQNGLLKIFNDRFGMRFLYYYQDEEIIIFAPEVKPILCCRDIERRQNRKALVNLAVMGFFLQDETHFQGIQLLSPGSLHTYDHGKFAKRKYWSVQFDDDVSFDKVDTKLLDTAYRLLEQSVAKRIGKNGMVGVPVSGGFDSRLLLGLSKRLTDNILAFSFGDRDCNEIVYGRQVAGTLGVEKHEMISANERTIIDNADLYTRLTHASASICNAVSAKNIEAIVGKVGVLMNGIFGGHMTIGSGSFRPSDIRLVLSREEEIRRIQAGKYIGFIWEVVFSENFKEEIRNSFEENVSEAFKESEKTSRKYCNKRDHFFFTNLLRRQSNHLNPYPFYVDSKLPFADYDLIDFYVSLPPEVRVGHKIYFEIYTKKLIELGEIPWISNSHLVRRGADQFISEEKKFRIRMLYYLGRLSGGRLVFRNRDWPYDFNYWYRTRKEFRNLFLGILLSERTRNRGFFSREGISRLIGLMDSGQNLFSTIDWLASFELGCRYLFDNE